MTAPNSPTRRKLLIAAGAISGAGVVGGTWIATQLDGTEAWIEATLRKHLPGITLDPASLATFVSSFAGGRPLRERQATLAIQLDQVASPIARHIQKSNRRIEQLERLVVSDYLSGSNFFRVTDPMRETIFYSGPLPACGNPFAKFRDA